MPGPLRRRAAARLIAPREPRLAEQLVERARLMEKYFDAHVYVTNWGSRVLMFRFPASALKIATLRPFVDGEAVRLRARAKDKFVGSDSAGDSLGRSQGQRIVPEPRH